jgi:Ca2+-binding RTX toxin-like protein
VGNDIVLNIENFILSRFDDRVTGDFNGNTLLGGRGNDRLDGNFGADSLSGGDGLDKITGGFGNDTLDGGTGRDTLTGNEGADVFLFSAGPAGDLAKNRDVITDFDAALDSIHLRRTGDGPFDALDFGALDESAFHIGTRATRGAHRIIYDDATGQLLYDADGKGGGAAVLFAVLEGAPDISAADFLVI